MRAGGGREQEEGERRRRVRAGGGLEQEEGERGRRERAGMEDNNAYLVCVTSANRQNS